VAPLVPPPVALLADLRVADQAQGRADLLVAHPVDLLVALRAGMQPRDPVVPLRATHRRAGVP
jgi:hypothetical protein